MGDKIPKVGREHAKKGSPRPGDRRRPGVADALFSATQQRVLGLLFGQPERSFSLSELIRLAQSGSGTVQREIERLGQSGIVTVTTTAGRKQVRANTSGPIFEELKGIVDKTIGVAAHLRKALDSNPGSVRFAALYGSVAKGGDASSSDIDVLLVSDHLALEDAFAMFEDAERYLGRRINPTVYSSAEFTRRRRTGHPFLTKILTAKHIVLVGSEDGLAT
jgi:predicted nucleotidyltransferase